MNEAAIRLTSSAIQSEEIRRAIFVQNRKNSWTKLIREAEMNPKKISIQLHVCLEVKRLENWQDSQLAD